MWRHAVRRAQDNGMAHKIAMYRLLYGGDTIMTPPDDVVEEWDTHHPPPIIEVREEMIRTKPVLPPSFSVLVKRNARL